MAVVFARPFVAVPFDVRAVRTGFARAAGEFGARIMFTGQVPERTRTMPLAVYGRNEVGELDTTLLLAVLLLPAAVLALIGVRVAGGPPDEPIR